VRSRKRSTKFGARDCKADRFQRRHRLIGAPVGFAEVSQVALQTGEIGQGRGLAVRIVWPDWLRGASSRNWRACS
jgi:hypothetical protein